jgi:hypothetical protein
LCDPRRRALEAKGRVSSTKANMHMHATS